MIVGDVEKKISQKVNLEKLVLISKKFSKINSHIENAQEIPNELKKTFITCDLSDNPYKRLR
jgi:hypothetical protein